MAFEWNGICHGYGDYLFEIYVDKIKCNREIKMKLGIITDIHNNAVALEAVLSEFERQGCEGILCCGDIIGIGPYPEETVKRIRELPNLWGCVRGNHERYLLEGMPTEVPNNQYMDYGEMEHHKWEHGRISAESKQFLGTLPYCQSIEVEGYKIYLAHYAMDEAHHYIHYVKEPTALDCEEMFGAVEADIIVFGHNHSHSCVHSKRLYINSGPLGCPAKDGNIARAGILTLETIPRYEQLEVPYDVSVVLQAMDTLAYPDYQNIKHYFYGQE